jgi:hypothetical protein
MKLAKSIAIVAAFILALTLTVWAAGGFHRGWTQTQIPTIDVDPITEIEFVTYRQGFVAGMDFLLSGTGIAAALFASSIVLILRSQRTQQAKNQHLKHKNE